MRLFPRDVTVVQAEKYPEAIIQLVRTVFSDNSCAFSIEVYSSREDVWSSVTIHCKTETIATSLYKRIVKDAVDIVQREG